MEIIYHFNIKENRAGEYAEHIAKNEQTMREHSPDGWAYRGTFFTVQGLGKYDAQQRWEIEDYSKLGAGWGHDETWDRILVESMGFLDGNVRANVVKSADEVGILEPS